MRTSQCDHAVLELALSLGLVERRTAPFTRQRTGTNSLHWYQFFALAPILALVPILCTGTNSSQAEGTFIGRRNTASIHVWTREARAEYGHQLFVRDLTALSRNQSPAAIGSCGERPVEDRSTKSRAEKNPRKLTSSMWLSRCTMLRTVDRQNFGLRGTRLAKHPR